MIIEKGEKEMVSSWVEGKEGVAEHLVYLNKEGKELQKLLAEKRTPSSVGQQGANLR